MQLQLVLVPRLVGAFALGHVADEQLHALAPVVQQRRRGQFGIHHRAVQPHQALLQYGQGGVLRRDPVQIPQQMLAAGRVDEFQHRAAHDFRGGEGAEQPQRRAIDQHHLLAAHHQQGVRRLLDQLAVPLLTRLQRRLGGPFLVPQLFGRQRVLHRLAQPPEPVLEEIIRRAQPDRRDGLLVANAAGNNEQRNIHAPFLQQLQRREAAEPGQVVVAQDDFGGRIQLRAKGLRRLHPFPDRLEARLAQFVLDQPGVAQLIFDQQHAERGHRHKNRVGDSSLAASDGQHPFCAAKLNKAQSLKLKAQGKLQGPSIQSRTGPASPPRRAGGTQEISRW